MGKWKVDLEFTTCRIGYFCVTDLFIPSCIGLIYQISHKFYKNSLAINIKCKYIIEKRVCFIINHGNLYTYFYGKVISTGEIVKYNKIWGFESTVILEH